MPAGDAAIEPGTYLVPRAAWSAVDFTVTFPEGWSVQYGHLYYNQDESFAIQPFVVDEIYAHACRGDQGASVEVGPGVDDLATALLEQPGTAKTGPVDTTLGGYPATRIDLRVPRRLQDEDCFLGPGTGLQLWLSPPDDYMVLGAADVVSVYVVDVDGQRQVFTAQSPKYASEQDRTELQEVLDSIHIEGFGKWVHEGDDAPDGGRGGVARCSA